MSRKTHNNYDEDFAGARFSVHVNNPPEPGEYYDGFSSRTDFIMDRIQRYFFRCREMLAVSASYLANPYAIASIILLTATYILLGVTGTVGFSFYSDEIVHQVVTNIDIAVNAILGWFFGPVTCCIGVTICTIARMAANQTNFFIGYVILASIAGFIHGWILFRLRTNWFGARFQGFFTDMLYRIVITRLVISSCVNILFKGLVFKIAIGLPLRYHILTYGQGDVLLTSTWQFLKVFFIKIAFEAALLFVILVVVNYVASKIFPPAFGQPMVIIDEDGEIGNNDDEFNP